MEPRRPPIRTSAGAGGARLFLSVAVVTLASRLPFLGAGYGTDPDAWRVAWAARTIAATGHYEASRFPGYPVQELLSALLWRGGPLALNGASALLAALGIAFFALSLRRLGIRDAALAAFALASTPVVYLASVTAMDYAWALGFALAALDLALRGRALAAGVLAGLAIGCRLPSVAWLVPLAILLARAAPRGAGAAPALRMVAAALAVGALAFLPVLLTYGPGFLRFYEHGYPPALYVLKNATVDLWGLAGFAALALAVALRLRPGARAPAAVTVSAAPGLVAACAAGIAIFLAIYLRLPIKAFYLIPVVPLAILLLARWLPRGAFVALCLALLASPWLLKVSEPGRVESPGPSRGAVALRLLGRPFVLDLLRGPLLTDRARREGAMRYVERSLERARRLEGESVVVAWDWLPQIRVRLGGKREGRVEFVYRLTAEELGDLRARGVRIFDLPGAEAENLKVNGVSLRAAGSRPLHAGE